jgi:hypothetical protein
MGLELNVNLLEDTIDTINESTETNDAGKEVDQEINVEKTTCTLPSHHLNASQNWNIKIANRLFENMPQFIYLGTTVTDLNLIHEGMERRLNGSNHYYHSVQNLLSPCLSSKT